MTWGVGLIFAFWGGYSGAVDYFLGVELMDVYYEIKRDEGLRLKPYKCSAGKLTIGYGRNLEDVGITESEAVEMLRHDITNATADLCREFDWFGDLSYERQKALVNMRFNLGMPKLKQFQKMLRAMKSGDFERAANEALDSKWAKQVGARAIRIADQIRRG